MTFLYIALAVVTVMLFPDTALMVGPMTFMYCVK